MWQHVQLSSRFVSEIGYSSTLPGREYVQITVRHNVPRAVTIWQDFVNGILAASAGIEDIEDSGGMPLGSCCCRQTPFGGRGKFRGALG